MIGADAVVAARRGHVLHPFGAIDLLLQRRGHSGFDGLRTGSRINGGDADLRRREVGKLGDRQRGDAGCARENDEQGADGGKYRAMNKKIDHKRDIG